MGVDLTNYIIYGVNLDYKEVKTHLGNDCWDKMEYYIEGHKDEVIAIVDGMCGKYIIIGAIIAQSESHDGAFEPNIYNLDILNFDREKWHLKIEGVLDKLELKRQIPNMLVVSHYH